MALSGRSVELAMVDVDCAAFLGSLLGTWEALETYQDQPFVLPPHDVVARFDDLRSFVVRLGESGEPIGFCRVFDHDERHARAQVGVIIHPDHRGQRRALEALMILLEWGFHFLGLERVEFRVRATNARSLAQCGQLGLHFDGRLRAYHRQCGTRLDVLIYSLLIDEYTTNPTWRSLRADLLPVGAAATLSQGVRA